MCAVASVACFEENVMQDVGEVEGVVGACYPSGEASVHLEKGLLVSFVHTVAN